MYKLEELQVEFLNDIDFKKQDLEDVTLYRARLYSRWLEKFTRIEKMLLKIEEEKDSLKASLIEEGDSRQKLEAKLMKTKEWRRLLDSERKLLAVKTFIMKALSQIEQLQWDIRNYIELKKLELKIL